MSELTGMTVNERLYETGLMSAFDRAAERQDVKALKEILRKVELDEEGVARVVEWVLNSPHSPHNRTPFELSAVLKQDARIVQLPVPKQRVVQHLLEQRGRTGTEHCQWKGCTETAVNGLAFCPYCAVVHMGLAQ